MSDDKLPPNIREIDPRQLQTTELSARVIEALNGCTDLDVVMTVLFNMTAQVMVACANGAPGKLDKIHKDVTSKMLIAARAKMIIDDDARRKREAAGIQ